MTFDLLYRQLSDYRHEMKQNASRGKMKITSREPTRGRCGGKKEIKAKKKFRGQRGPR